MTSAPPQRLRAILVDDERLARQELRSMLDEYAQIEVVGEAASASAAVELIESVAPDVVFLDVQMPGRSGFELLEEVDADFRTIFVTAFDAHAIRAFDVNAIDYLLKPVSPERLARAVARLAAGGAAGEAETSQASARLLEYGDPLFLTVDNRPRLVRVNTISHITSAGDHSEVFTVGGKKLFVLKSLKEWEERLPPAYFSRIHRSTIVNMECVDEIEEWFNRSYRVVVRGVAEPFAMSRRYAAKLKARFG